MVEGFAHMPAQTFFGGKSPYAVFVEINTLENHGRLTEPSVGSCVCLGFAQPSAIISLIYHDVYGMHVFFAYLLVFWFYLLPECLHPPRQPLP